MQIRRSVKRIVAMITVICLIAACIPLQQFEAGAEDTANSGTCGECTWTIDTDGVLTIAPENGESGELSSGGFGWLENALDVKKAVFEDGVKATECRGLFSDCSNLESVDLNGLDTSKVTDMSYMFNGCSSLKSLDLNGLDTSSVTNMSWIFSFCNSLASVGLSGLDTSSVTDMSDMFFECNSLISVDLSGLDVSSLTNMSNVFNGCDSLTSVDLSGLDTSSVTNMQDMFYKCSSLESVDLSGLDTSSVTNMYGMFFLCSSLAGLDLDDFDTSQVTDMSLMFDGCSSLVSLDLGGFDTSQVEFMNGMFYECSSLADLNLGSFNTSQVTDMSLMFDGCSSLVSLDLRYFDVSQVTDMNAMFYGCSSLETVYLGEFNISNVQHMTDMFGLSDKVTLLLKEGSLMVEYAETNSILYEYIYDVADLDIHLSETSYTYDGSSKEPAVTIAGMNENEDFTVEYRDNVDAGTATVTVTGIGKCYGSSEIEYEIKKADRTLVVDVDKTRINAYDHFILYSGQSSKIEAESDGNIRFTSSDDEIASVDRDGNITALNPGKAVITVTAEGTSNYSDISDTVTVYVKGKVKDVVLDSESVIYDGTAKEPEVLSIAGDDSLTEGTDYEVVYVNNVNAGTATAVVVGKGKWEGIEVVTFEIQKADISKKTMSLSGTSYTYNGSAKVPTVNIEGLGKNKDYTVKYSSNTKCGKAKVVITGTGNYKGSITKYFRIVPAKASLSKATAGSKKITVSIKSQKTSGVTGYQIYYKKAGSDAKYVYTTSTSKVLTKLVKGKKYTVKVRAYKTIDGEKVPGAWSASKTVTVK